jgi:hypothetical protein
VRTSETLTEGEGMPRTRNRPGLKAWLGCVSVAVVGTTILVGYLAFVVWAFRWLT